MMDWSGLVDIYGSKISMHAEARFLYEQAFDYSKLKGERSPHSERLLIRDPYWAYRYAKEVIGGRWPEAEPVILTNQIVSEDYALTVVKERWPAYEAVVIKDLYHSLRYAIDVVGGMWLEGEAAWKTSPDWCYGYAVRVLKKRWLAGEECVAKSGFKDLYLRKFPEARDDWALNGWTEWL